MAVPDPVIWEDGEEPENIPSADALNLEWRDAFTFLISGRPMIIVHSSSGQSLTTTPTAITFNVETLNRGGMTHSTSVNSQNITVPYTGWYQGYVNAGFATFSTTATKAISRVLIGSTIVASAQHPPALTAGQEYVYSFTAQATAGDVFTMTMHTTTGTAVAANATTNRPRMAMWFAGNV